nr:pre-mRNA splicing Prp18-interacting factor [Tanacetum cinerariifolium]
MSTFVLCVGCGEPLYGFSPCQWCTCELCGNNLRDGFCSLCNSKNSCVYDPNPNSFYCSPDSYHPPHPTYETDSGDSCGNDSHFGYASPPRFPLNYEPEPGYIQNYNSYPHDSPSFPQQYLCCDNYGGPHETFQCFVASLGQSFQSKDALGNKQYKPEDIQELFCKLFNDVQNIHEELAKYINTPGWNRSAFCNNGDDDDEDCTIAVTPDFPITDSLIMDNEQLDTIPETKSDEFIKSSVENLVPIPSESENFLISKVNVICPIVRILKRQNFSTFSNPLFDDSTSSDDESSHEEVIHEIGPVITIDDSDSEGGTLSLERLLHDDPIPLPDTLDISYDIQVFLPFFTYPVTSSILLSSGSEDTIFDPVIYHFSSLEPGLSHRCGTFKKFNTRRSHLYSRKLEESCQRILSSKSSFPQLQLGIMYQNLIN